MVLCGPKSAESCWPLFGVNRLWRFQWWTTRGAKGRFIAMGPLYFRWGAP